MRFVHLLPAAALAALLVTGGSLLAEETKKPAGGTNVSFGTLQTPDLAAARAEALKWLKDAGKSDEASLKAFEAVWADADRALINKVADTIALGDPEAAKLLAEARDPNAVAPEAVPAQLRDAKKPAFYRANLALAYGKALSTRRVFETSLETLRLVKPEQVVDPGAYLFHRAVAEHALILKGEATASVLRLLDEAPDAAERYRVVAALMHFDMLTWQDKDLGWVARMMDNSGRRLDHLQGGQKTQKIQKQIVARLDEIIKELENQRNGNGQGNGGSCPDGGNGNRDGQPNNLRSSNPLNDSQNATSPGKGDIDIKRLKEVADVWGKLPDKEKVKALVELTRGLSPKYQKIVEDYFMELSKKDADK